ncbi:MAG TPA: hypothetical protein VMM18_16990 [Gemmatimonadaceae bacterium]|nr:hypothetical protein [Gemmatimonadaceae bacterium]
MFSPISHTSQLPQAGPAPQAVQASQAAQASQAPAAIAPSPPATPGPPGLGPEHALHPQDQAGELAEIINARVHQQISEAMQGNDFVFGPGIPPIPEELIALVLGSLALLAVMLIGFPIARAIARRIDRHTVAASSSTSPDVVARLDRIEQAVETMAIEVERISEGQRYSTRLLTDHVRELQSIRNPE